ncbi:MAG: D-cysteine desulfhydrase family protein [Thermoflexales bacterium]|nr:D-cysteine desulfhydrase family protein [Thermoflexales bacterium]
MLTAKLPRIHLAHLPTAIEPLPRLGAYLGGPQLFVKRDDQTGLASGGNKARKLEFLLADAQVQGADTLITAGAAQSNHARQTAAAAAQVGLGCVLVLCQPLAGSRPQGNWLLDKLLGADIRWVADKSQFAPAMEDVAGELRARGHTPYIVPYGGSSPTGAAGYVAAMEEIVGAGLTPAPPYDHIVFASSSGGTQAGLAVGARALNYQGRLLGISVDEAADVLQARVARLATATAAQLGLNLNFEPGEIQVNADYLGGGYGVMGELESEAIGLSARFEGLLLDPVYTGRALGGLIDLLRRGAFRPDERVLFLHTGGLPALFAYNEQVSRA